MRSLIIFCASFRSTGPPSVFVHNSICWITQTKNQGWSGEDLDFFCFNSFRSREDRCRGRPCRCCHHHVQHFRQIWCQQSTSEPTDRRWCRWTRACWAAPCGHNREWLARAGLCDHCLRLDNCPSAGPQIILSHRTLIYFLNMRHGATNIDQTTTKIYRYDATKSIEVISEIASIPIETI